ncbi:cbb3-type cytochrome oxidase assembly protein CcoS [Pusillimonas sp.]|uniref:cbb3-type cytochrome oxidase assembly protein CcoS n=1 Tax=Pusillimonas sp. TaxID=3040095 RepID=UPI0037CC51AC
MYLLIAISVVFVVAIGAAFWWAIFAGQFDNSEAAGKSILHDDDTGVGEKAGEDQAAEAKRLKD